MPLIETVPALNEAREAIESPSILIVIGSLFTWRREVRRLESSYSREQPSMSSKPRDHLTQLRQIARATRDNLDRATFALTDTAPARQGEPFALRKVENRSLSRCPNDGCPVRPKESHLICLALVSQKASRRSKQLSGDVKMRDTRAISPRRIPDGPHIDTSSPRDQICRHHSRCDSITAIEVTSEDVGRKWQGWLHIQ